ncbi:hypothetical protein B9Z65_1662 [Elsinoe australis]|uniref:RNA exonuclease 4 n=1 Tax=Elsinoe australis TaxID=40998 RepID=A0A2P7YGI5_9PEZI|nr:hypothetical protein B9Z65_1662 [Elsinoe australis]
MPGIELSSNWKKLQSSIKSDVPKPSSISTTTLKRKRPTSTSKPTSKPPPSRKRPKMSSASASTSITSKALASPPPRLTPPPTDISHAPHPTSLNVGLTPSPAGRYLSLDCEMVSTKLHTHSLARVSLTNYHHAILYDSFVLPLPSDPVTDYRTHVSGVAAHHLRPGFARPFAEVQKAVADLLRGRVLVGHALGNDLKVLGLDHPGYAIRDTARYKGFKKFAGGRTPALRVLAKEVLGLGIQEGVHDSVVDARVAMELFRREKGGMEGEVRIKYGRLVEKVGREVVKGKVGVKKLVEEVSKGDEDEDEDQDAGAESALEGSELLDGESDGEESGSEVVEDAAKVDAEEEPKKKKRKKRKHKSRTTRA